MGEVIGGCLLGGSTGYSLTPNSNPYKSLLHIPALFTPSMHPPGPSPVTGYVILWAQPGSPQQNFLWDI